MCKVISIVNQKGGVAKTTSTYNLSAILAMENKQVLMIDLDPQASLTISAGIEPGDESLNGLYSGTLFETDANVEECAVTLSTLGDRDNFYIIPSDIKLSKWELSLVNRTNRERILKRSISKLKQYFDYIIIDCPPSMGLLTLNALMASDGVIIPCETKYLAYRGLGFLKDTIKVITNPDEELNPELEVIGIIGTRFKSNTNDHKDVVELLKSESYPYLGTIKEREEGSKTNIDGVPIVCVKKSCDVSRAYYEVARKAFGIGE